MREILRYLDTMAKWLLKAVLNKDQVRISLPKPLIKQMNWEGMRYMIAEKKGDEIRILPFLRKRDLE